MQENMRLKEDAWMEQTGTLQSGLAVLQEQVQQKEQAIEQLQQTKQQQELLIDELQHKLEERERLSKEMFLVMKDIETRFSHFQTATEVQPVINGNGHMQYQ
jgi:mannitol/fructose-specific phosphotransferase system IIA component (Ntr-type)